MLARVHVEEKIRQGALEAGSPTFVNGKPCACNFRGYGEIENSRALADFPVGLGNEIEFGWRAPAADFFVVRGTGSHGNRRVRQIGDSLHELTLLGVQFGDLFVRFLYLRGQLFQIR